MPTGKLGTYYSASRFAARGDRVVTGDRLLRNGIHTLARGSQYQSETKQTLQLIELPDVTLWTFDCEIFAFNLFIDFRSGGLGAGENARHSVTQGQR